MASTARAAADASTAKLQIARRVLQPLIARLSEPEAIDNRVYDLLLQDYVNYHAVLVVGGSVFAVAALYVTGRSLKARAARRETARSKVSVVQQPAHLFLAITSAMTALLFLLLSAINLSTVLSPHEGLVQTFEEAAARSSNPEKALSGDTLRTWIETGDERLPPRLQTAVDDRLAWQRPKAMVCWGLLFLSLLLTIWAWRAIDRERPRTPTRPRAMRAALIATAVVGIPVCVLLMVLALANTQASIAPIVITLAAG